MTAEISVAVLGAGHGHSNLYNPALAAHPRARVVAIAEADAGKRAYRAEQLGTPTQYASAFDLLEQEADLDLVLVLGEHDTMADAALAVIARGIPFLLEKPGGLTLGEVARVRAEASAANAAAVVPFVQRYGPLAELTAAVGTVQHATLQFLAGPASRYRSGGSEWLLDPERAGGGAMLNLGVHVLDAFAHFAADGRDVEVLGSALRTFEPGLRVEDYFTATLAAGDAVAEVSASYTFPSVSGRYVSYAVRGEMGFAAMGPDGIASFTDRGGRKRTAALDADSDRYYGPFLDRILAGLDNNFAGLPGLDDLVRVRALTDAVSARSRHPQR